MREELDCFGNSFGASFGDVDSMAAIMLGGGSNVPSIDSVWCPSASVCWCFMDKNSGARWSEGSAIVIEGSIQVCFGRDSWVQASRAKKIEGGGGLCHEPTPEVHGEIGVDAGEARNEVALPSVDGFFGSVGPVHVGRGKLQCGAGLADVGLETFWAFVVEDVEGWTKSSFGQMLVELGECSQEFSFASGLEWLGENGGGIMVVEDHHILVTAT